jgi:pimeloyl-ACP methyl ester carboxylesterase
VKLTKLVRSGTLISSSLVSTNNASAAAIHDYKPSKIVHVGHAYGSYIMFIMLGQYADISDAALMTGLLINYAMLNNTLTVLNYNHAFPRENDPVRFAEWGSGYFVLDNKQTLQKLFFQKRTMDPALLDYAEAIKQPESVGTYSSEGNSTLAPALPFKGPVMFFTGEFDNYICNGDCRGVYDEELTKALFPNAADVTPYLQPGGGHATGLSKGAREGYEVQLKWLEEKGL